MASSKGSSTPSPTNGRSSGAPSAPSKSSAAKPPRLDGAGTGRDLRHAGHPRRRGHRVRLRLVQRRPAIRNEGQVGRLVSVPYTLELNDIPIYAVQHHRSPEIFERTKDQFDTLYAEGAEGARVMAISTHPYITGVSHRIKYFDMIFDYISRFQGRVVHDGQRGSGLVQLPGWGRVADGRQRSAVSTLRF